MDKHAISLFYLHFFEPRNLLTFCLLITVFFPLICWEDEFQTYAVQSKNIVHCIHVQIPIILLSLFYFIFILLTLAFFSFPFLSSPSLSSPFLSIPLLSFHLISSLFYSFPLLSSGQAGNQTRF